MDVFPRELVQRIVNGQAWRLWNEGNELELVDSLLTESCPAEEILRCVHIGLLCVQGDPTDRPTISSVVVLVESKSVSLPEPKQPAFSVGRGVQFDQSPSSNPSTNHLTVSGISPRWGPSACPVHSFSLPWSQINTLLFLLVLFFKFLDQVGYGTQA